MVLQFKLNAGLVYEATVQAISFGLSSDRSGVYEIKSGELLFLPQAMIELIIDPAFVVSVPPTLTSSALLVSPKNSKNVKDETFLNCQRVQKSDQKCRSS